MNLVHGTQNPQFCAMQQYNVGLVDTSLEAPMTHDELIPFLLTNVPLFETFSQDNVEAIAEGS